MMQDKLTRAIKVMHGWHKLSGILGGKIYPGKVHLFSLRHIHIGTNAIAKNMQISIIKQIIQIKCMHIQWILSISAKMKTNQNPTYTSCLLYTSDAADE